MPKRGEFLRLMATGSLVVAGCAPEQRTPQEPSSLGPDILTPSPLPSPEPFSLIDPDATPEFFTYAKPVNPPEFRRAYGGAFPEAVRGRQQQAYYRSLEIQKRNEEGPFLVSEEEYYPTLDEFRERRGYEVLQRWNNDLANFQMVTTLVRRNAGTSEVRWFVTQAGAFMARPDSLPEGADPRNPPQVWVPLPQGTRPEFAFGTDRHVYLFALDEQTSQDVFWFNTTEANAFEEGGMDEGWQLHPSVEELAESWSLDITSYAFQRGRWIALDGTGKTVLSFEPGKGEWKLVGIPTNCLDPEVNAQVVSEYLTTTPYRTLQEAMDAWREDDFNPSISYGGLNKSTGRNGEEIFISSWWRAYLMKIVGGYRFSLAEQSGFGEGDSAYCILAASPHLGDVVAPLIIGIERDEVWTQTTQPTGSSAPNTPYRVSWTTPEEADAWIRQNIGLKIYPFVTLRFDRPDWDWDHRSGIYQYNALLPLMRNPNGYIMRYTLNPEELGPQLTDREGKPWGEQANLYNVIQELNREPGGDVGLFASQIGIRK